MCSPMMPGMPMSSRGSLPYMPRARPGSLHPNPTNSHPEGELLTKQTSKSSRTSGSEPSRSSQEAPLAEPDRPAGATGIGPDPSEHQHGHQRKQQQHQQQHQQRGKKNQKNNRDQAQPNAASTPNSASTTRATPPPHATQPGSHQRQTPSSSNTSPPLELTSSPRPAPQSAFRRASHNFISRGKQHHDTGLSSQESKNAHAQQPSSPRAPAAAQMTGTAPVAFAEIFAHSALGRNMSSATDASSSSHENLITSKPFVLRNGRSYLNDTSLPYPLPADLTELHRQSMRTLLLMQVFGSPVCSSIFSKRPPQRVLEIGCGSGFWSMMCHRYFKSRGHGNISFTGIDIAPLAPTTPMTSARSSRSSRSSGATLVSKPDPEMKWSFISHDLRQLPWPLESQGFDLVMVKDMSLATTNLQHQAFIDEYVRLLRPGGVLEIWESDHLIRMLRPHVPEAKQSGDDTEDQEAAASLGAYVMNANTPLSAPLNPFLVEYNQWLSRALESRDLTAVPCTLIGPTLLQESETLTDVRSRRLAIPLSEVRWEREGVGGVITKDGKSTASASSQSKSKTTLPPKVESRVLSPGQEALRQTALLTVVQQVQALEPILREVSGKSQDEWDVWMGKMMGDLMSDSGTSWGECLEVGAWSATKRRH